MRNGKFKIEIGNILKDNNRDLTIIDRIYKYAKRSDGYNQKQIWYKYKCNKCGWDQGWTIESSLLKQKTGCACCCPYPRVVVEGINDIPTTAPWMVKYFQGGYDEAKLYNKSSNKLFVPICPYCGNIKDTQITINQLNCEHSIGCKYCGDTFSYPNKIMFNILNQLNINFVSEYCPKWISPKRFDFYFKINNRDYIVEMDGNFHYTNNLMNNQSKSETKKLDDYKDLLAKENNIEVIRIDCKLSDINYIKENIFNSNLSTLINLSLINWSECEEFALSNLCKKACELRKDGFSACDISDIMKINRTTIIKFLKKGHNLKWCVYNPKEEMIKSGKLKGKKVGVFKNNIMLGIFDSCNDIELQSEKLFGIKLYRSGISEVCNGIRKHYKKYYFQYI